MSVRFDGEQPGLAGAFHFGDGGLGVTGAVIRATTGSGTHGPGLLYNDWDGAEDDPKEFRALITQVPGVGTFFAFEDGSFTFTGAPDGTHTGQYRLYVDGADLGLQGFSIVIGDGLFGSSAVTLGPFTQAAAGTVAIAGTAAQILAALGHSATGVVQGGLTGSASTLLGPFEHASFGSVGIAGTAAQALGAFGHAATGLVVSGIVGNGDATMLPLLHQAEGVVGVAGSAGQQLGQFSHAAAGQLAIAGAGTFTMGPILQTAAGLVGAFEITGTAAQTLAPLQHAASAAVAITGQASQVLASFTMAAAGLVGDYGVPGIPAPARRIAVRRVSRRIPVTTEPRTKMLPKFMNPGAELDWALDWRAPEEEDGPYLADDDTVQSATWALEGSLLTKLGEELEGDQTQIKLRMSDAAAAGATCSAICSIVTAKGLKDSRRIVFEVGAG